jgi:hypothetical protein
MIAEMPDESHSLKGFKKGALRALISVDHGRHHMSISCANRNPTWEEIKEARYELLPLGKHFVMALSAVAGSPNSSLTWVTGGVRANPKRI